MNSGSLIPHRTINDFMKEKRGTCCIPDKSVNITLVYLLLSGLKSHYIDYWRSAIIKTPSHFLTICFSFIAAVKSNLD